MPISSNSEIIQDFIAELKNYIPTLVDNIDCLKKDPGQKKALEELHRLVHRCLLIGGNNQFKSDSSYNGGNTG